MKRLITVLILIMALSGMINASAEAFTVRNGLTFGMSVEDVTSFELNTNSVTISPYKDNDGVINYYMSSSVNIAGYGGSTIHYGFDETGKLRWIEYWIEPTDGYKYVKDLSAAFEVIEPSLKKYDEISLGALEGLDGQTFLRLYNVIDGTSKNAVQCGKSERLAVFDNEYVLIQHLSMLAGNMPWHIVSYRLQEDEMVKKIYQDFSDAQKYIQDSMKNDF